MEPLSARALTGQLADDLGWLEEHCRRQSDQATAAVRLRLAAALVRNCIGPALDEQPAAPLHVAVLGGAGAGKSTVANMLSGARRGGGQSPSRLHPPSHRLRQRQRRPLTWAGHLGFLGPLQRLTQPAPSSLDEDVYQVRRVPADPTSYDLLKDFVVWDCPDMTTWASVGYVPRLLEIAALADVIVFVASDERYNDEVPTQFLNLFLQAGKPVVVCFTEDARGRRGAVDRSFPARSRSRDCLPGVVELSGHSVPDAGATGRPGPPGRGLSHPAAESSGRAGRVARRHAAAQRPRRRPLSGAGNRRPAQRRPQ